MPDPHVERYTDIANAPISVGDIVILRDVEAGHLFRFEVLREQPNNDGTKRVFAVKVIESSDPHLKVNQVIANWELQRHVKVWGCVIRQQDMHAVMSEEEVLSFAAIELRKFLDAHHESNFRMKYTTCVAYLQSINFIPKGEHTDAKVKRAMSAVLRKNPTWFRSKGGWVSSTGVSYSAPSTYKGSEVHTKRVDFRKYMLAQRLMLESGFYGPVELFNAD